MNSIKFLKKSVAFFKWSKKDNEKTDEIAGCTPQLNNPPSSSSSSHQEEVKCSGEAEEVKCSVEEEEEECSANDTKATKLFVGGLDPSTTSEDLENYFSGFGPITRCIIPREHVSKRSRGFGFVIFVDPDNAKAALEIKDHFLNGRVVDLKPYRAKASERKYENRIHLRGLPFEITKEHLRQFFSQFGEVEDVVIPVHKDTEKSKGFGFLSFKDKSAVEKCLAVRFVSINGRQIFLRKANPPDSNKMNKDLSVDSTFDTDVEEGLEVTETCDISDNNSSSVVSEESSDSEINSVIQKLYQGYLLNKLSNFNPMDEKKNKDGFNSDGDLDEVQKLLADFLINSTEQLTGSGKDLIEFSDNSEDSDSDEEEEEEDTTDEENDVPDDYDDYGDAVVKYYESQLQKLNEKFTDVLEKKSKFCAEISDSKSSAPEISEFLNCQKSSMPFNIKDDKGALVCSLCQWVPPDNSDETFLAHCKTAAHRAKLKNRFVSEQNTEKISETVLTQNNKLTQEMRSEAKIFPKKNSTQTQESRLMKGHENSKSQKRKEKGPQQKLKPQERPQAMKQLKKKKTSEEKRPGEQKNIKKETSQNLKTKEEKIKAVKINALAKSMASIQPLSEHELICKMCNKIIPKAVDMNALMRNVSHHLQSRRHLSTVFKMENSSQKNPQQKHKKGKGGGESKKNTVEEKTAKKKNPPNAPKAEVSKKNIPKNPVPVPKVSNPKSSAPETAKNNPQKEKTDKKKINSNAADLKGGDYLCLSCKLYFQNNEGFKAHLNSKTHLTCLNSKKEKMVSAPNNSHKCNGCKTWLTGSLYDINEHYVKCLVRQN